MRILLSSLLIFAFPITGTALGGSGTNVGVQVNHKAAEASGDTIKAASQAYEHQSIRIERHTDAYAALLSRSDILKDIQGVTLETVLRVKVVFQAFVQPNLPSSSDFWESVKESEKNLQDCVHSLLGTAATYFKSTKFTDIRVTMNHIVNATTAFRDNIKAALDARHGPPVTFDTFSEELEGIFMAIVNDLEQIPPPDKAPSHAERAKIVDKVLDDTEQALIKLATRFGIQEEIVTTYLDALKPHVHALIVTIGDINEQHPKLFPALAFSVVVLLIPESWILKPFLRMFGFGPYGPVKGSFAAWLQSRFWGAAVAPGSWFSWLQAAGMGVLPASAGVVAKIPIIGGILGSLLPDFNRG
ncbi:hypothetical protein L210DRAFT_2492856 [Boletus edulis BED1]|uniref:Uncharacterized protein n=1 Tax=Boletus edulis BED1 TaxID=1328754 RepID=A0AAD4BNN3_BOLED|nr:hypothetical protein L210DRAFT_2492856 [Boletus edulis BED1]